jgi:hypothetical protein
MATIRPEFVEGASFWLFNHKVEWCHVEEAKPDIKYGKSQWCITVRLDEERYKSLKEVGFNAKWKHENRNWKEGDEDYMFIMVYSKTETSKGPNPCPKMTMKDTGEPYLGAIGNGTLMDVKVWGKYIEVNGETMLPAYLDGGSVRELVIYSPEPDVPDDGDDRSGCTFKF